MIECSDFKKQNHEKTDIGKTVFRTSSRSFEQQEIDYS